MAHETAGRDRRNDRRRSVLAVVLARREEMRALIPIEGPPARERRLAHRIAGELVAAGRVGGCETGERRFRRRGTPYLQELRPKRLPPVRVTMFTALPVLPPYSAENEFVSTVISCTAGKGMLLKIVCRPQLIVAVAAIHFERCLSPPRAIGGEEIWFVKISPWLIGGTVGGIQQREISDAARGHRCLLQLTPVDAIAQLGRVRADFARHARHVDARVLLGHREREMDGGGGAALERDAGQLRVRETGLARGQRVCAIDGERFHGETARVVALGCSCPRRSRA